MIRSFGCRVLSVGLGSWEFRVRWFRVRLPALGAGFGGVGGLGAWAVEFSGRRSLSPKPKPQTVNP